ncbi:MAG: hypothetical protein DRP62_03440 [Planctomycetota bacterium]|nr:MAG: hypothetical protein DRP62_03440 [Planctomycetota bacterium]
MLIMARNRKRKSLYEVISKSQYKVSYDKRLEQLHPESPDKDKLPVTNFDIPASQQPTQWPTKPRIVQFNTGRIETSMPYPLAIALVMGIVLLVLVVFRLGQNAGLTGQIVTNSAVEATKNQEQAVKITQAPEAVEKITPLPDAVEKVEPARPTGNNRIVIQTHRLRAYLEPVKQYFAQFGIETEIRQIGGMYYLVTKQKYKNPEKVGTDGYYAKKKIVELGANYKSPQGYGTFGKKPFHDAYGMKFDD